MSLNRFFVGVPKAMGISLLALGSALSFAAEPEVFTYPSAGQSQEQMQKDRYECYRWAVSATGVDPSTLEEPAASYSTTVVANQNRGDTAKGTVIGTIAGAVIGSTIKSGGGHHHRDEHRNTAAGAVVGATVGAIIGSQNEQSGYRKAQEQAAVLSEKQQREQQAYEQGINDYMRAFSACMAGRHYSVR